MSSLIPEMSISLVKRLISHVTGYEENNAQFDTCFKNTILKIEKSDSMCFKSRDEMDKIVESLSHKFLLHGFQAQANEITTLYHTFMDKVSTFYDATNKRSIIRFIIAMADNPTNNFYKFNQICQIPEKKDDINWPEYLQEGLPKWSHCEYSDSDWSDDSDISSDNAFSDEASNTEICYVPPELDKKEEVRTSYEIYCDSKQKLLDHIQNKWFCSENVREEPVSSDKEANIAFLWDTYINEITGGLLLDAKPNVISEYKVLREIIWQFYEPTNSVCFEFSGDKLVVKKNVTVSSIREYCFETVVSKFLPYVEIIQSLRSFEHQVHSYDLHAPNGPGSPPDTYRCYASSLGDILDSLFMELREIEDEIIVQESISTLMTLFQRLKPVFETLGIIKKIHDDIVTDSKGESRLFSATFLIAKLYKKLSKYSTKLEVDIAAALFLQSLKKYLDLVESWVFRDTFHDATGEFVIQEGENSNRFSVDYKLKELNEHIGSDDIIDFFCTEVLEIGKNVKLLRILGKSNLTDLIPEAELVGDSLHSEYVDAVLNEINKYCRVSENTSGDVVESTIGSSIIKTTNVEIFSPVETDGKLFTTPNDLDNLVDTSDGFLMEAFRGYFSKDVTSLPDQKPPTCYDRLCKANTGVAPLQRIIKTVLFNLFSEKFSGAGSLAKTLLITEHKLEVNFKFLKQVFLFEGELIFPFYRRFIEQIESHSQMNQMWLTTYLRDILLDTYPDFSDECLVEMKKNWELCDDSLKMCTLIRINTTVKWPINLIVQNHHMEMYHNVFQFILKIKWAMYTLNHLYFKDLEPRYSTKVTENPNRLVRILSKLKIFRFALINDFSSIQHYILGYIYARCNTTFQMDFQKSNDFFSIFCAHDKFITGFHKECIGFRDFRANNHGFYLLLYLVKKLSIMWKNPSHVNVLELDKYYNLEKQCHKLLEKIIINRHVDL